MSRLPFRHYKKFRHDDSLQVFFSRPRVLPVFPVHHFFLRQQRDERVDANLARLRVLPRHQVAVHARVRVPIVLRREKPALFSELTLHQERNLIEIK